MVETQRQTVLVVDDDATLLASYVRALERSGRSVMAAETAAKARELVRDRRPDAGIIDLSLPDRESGIELIRELRKRDAEIVLILVTGYGNMAVGAAAALAGANHVLAKPIEMSEILRRLTGAPCDEIEVETPSLDRAMWEHMHRVLADCNGNKSEAARRLRVNRATLQRWLDRNAPES